MYIMDIFLQYARNGTMPDMPMYGDYVLKLLRIFSFGVPQPNFCTNNGEL